MLSLIVTLPPQPSAATALRFALSPAALAGHGAGGGEHPITDHGAAALALLPRADELVAVVPLALLSWHRVTLPKVASARLRSALDGLLEERLLDEPAAMHFALGPRGTVAGHAGEVWVAACDKAWLQAALQAFEAAGRPVARIVPEYAPLEGDQAPQWHALGPEGQAQLVRCGADGVQSLPLSGGARVALAMAAPDAAGVAPQIWADPAVAAQAESLLGHKVQVRHSSQAMVGAALSGWDLAQFDLASTGGTRLARRAAQGWAQLAGSAAWRPARWGVAALVAAQVVGLNLWALQERAALEAKRAEVKALLTRSFPKVAVVIDAPLQMEREVAVLRQSTGAAQERDLEPMLGAVSASFKPSASVNRSIAAINYVAGELTLKGFSPAPADAAALTAGIVQAGYTVRADGDTWVVRSEGDAPSAGAKP